MNRPEEPLQPFDYRTSFRQVPFEQLPPKHRQVVDAAFASMEHDPSAVDVQTLTYTNGTGFDQIVQSEPRPQYWARWEYSDEEWGQFDKLDWGRARNTLLITATITTLVFLSFILLISLAFFSSPSAAPVLPMLLAILVPVGFLLPTSLITFAFAGRQFQEARKRHNGRKSGPKRVTIGTLSSFNDQGIWEAGSFVPLQETFLSLRNVHMTAYPALLHLRRKHLMIRQSSWHDTVRVLVPRGHEAEAAQLVERFRAETIASKNRSYTPSEPA